MKYKLLAELYTKIEGTTKRLEKTFFVSEFLKDSPVAELDKLMLLFQGRVFPPWDERKIGVAAKLVLKAINVSTGISLSDIEKEWKKTGDLGLTAENLVRTKKQGTLFAKELSVKKVFDNLQKLSSVEGTGSVDIKTKLISELLTSAEPDEARFIVRNVLEDLRVGIGDGVIRDAIVWAYLGDSLDINYDSEKKAINPADRDKYNSYVAVVQSAYDILNDFAKVVIVAKEKGLSGLRNVKLAIGRPLKVMLYPKAIDIEDAFKRVGKPAAIEYKYDGFRMQVHRKGNKIQIFTRRLDEVTQQFPEVVDFVRNNVTGDEYILDGEALGYDPKSGEYLPFQKMSQRIKRKYDIKQMALDFPVELNVFDILCHDGESVIKKPFSERRALIEKMIKSVPKKIRCAKQLVTEDPEKANVFYQESLQAGEEGVMFKKMDGIYKPGARVGYGVKVKPVMESLDLVIVGAEWGNGKRSAWLTSFTLACHDPDTDEFLTIGKVGTGMKELEQEEGVTFSQLTEALKPHIIGEKGKEVSLSPVLVVEINFEEIQKSPTYTSGYALRFPRVVRLRDDRSPDEASDIDLVEELFATQRSRS